MRTNPAPTMITCTPSRLHAHHKRPHLTLPLRTVDRDQVHACRTLLLALPRSDAIALLRKRNVANLTPCDLRCGEAVENATVVASAAQEVALFLQQWTTEEVAIAPGSCGRGGAVRRRKGSESGAAAASEKRASTVAERGMEVDDSPATSDDGKAAAAAAGDLLQLAGAASCAPPPTRTSRSSLPAQRSRDAKPYQRSRAGRGGRGGGSGSAGDECWLPGGFWWQDERTPMPSGRQPGELAGWRPLAGELNQQRLQDQRQTLSRQEQIVMGLGSRDDAAAYLQQLRRTGADHGASQGDSTAEMRPITTSVDDSVIEHSSTFKQLASWGGFRRHFKCEATDGREEETPSPARGSLANATASAEISNPTLDSMLQASSDPTWKDRLRDQLLQKRAEIIATQQRLESLSLEQQELEMLYTRAHS